MAAPCQPCNAGPSRCHLRRIGSRAPVSGIADVIHFWKTVTLIGRKREVVDYFLSCVTPRGINYISRIHARVIRTSTYELVDSSLTGVFVNDVRIDGSTFLQEGDTITFGHPAPQSIVPGARARQPNSPFYFLFEHCHCSLDGTHHLPGEFPALAAAEASPEANVGLGSEEKVAPPWGACAIPGFLPTCPALSDQKVQNGCYHPAAISTPTLPLSSSASVRPPVLPQMPTGSQRRRSLSPEYAALEQDMPEAPEASPHGALETKPGSVVQDGPESICSDPAGRNKKPPEGSLRGSHTLCPHGSSGNEAGTRPLHAVFCDHILSSLPASAGLDVSVAADLSSSQRGSRLRPPTLPQDVQQFACSSQMEQGGGPEPELSPPGTKELVSGGSGHKPEVMKMENNESPEGTATSGTACLSEPGAQEQVPEVMGEEVSGDQVTSVGCSGDTGPGEERTLEGQGEVLTEKPSSETGLQETEPAAVVRMTDNPELSPLGTKELVSGGFDHNKEIMKMENNESTEGAVASGTACLSELGAQEQVPEVMEEDVSGDQVTSVGCSGDTGPGEERTLEGQGQVLTEKPSSEAGPHETEWAAVVRMTDNPELSPLDTKELVSGGSGHNQETMKMEINESPEGTATSGTACLSEPGAQEQVPEMIGEVVSGDQVTSAGCSGDTGLGEEGTLEGEGEVFTEKPSSEAGLQETERAAVVCMTDNPELSPLGTKKLVSGGSGHNQEMMKMEINESPEGTVASGTACLSEPGAQEQVPEVMEEDVSGDQVTSVGCSGDPGPGEEGVQGEVLTEKPSSEAGLQETEQAAVGSVRDHSLTSNMDTLVPETLGLVAEDSGKRTLDNILCGQQPDRVLPQVETDPKALSPAVPCETQGGRDASETDSQESASEEERETKMVPPGVTRGLATGCLPGPADPEMESDVAEDPSLADLSFAEVGTQTGDAEAREMGLVLTEAGEDRGASRASAGHMTEKMLVQQFSGVSASEVPAHEASSKEEFSREGTVAAEASCGATQESSSSEDLLAACREDTSRAAAAPPAGLVLGEGMVLEAGLQEQAMDLDERCSEERLSQGSEACTEGELAERELEHGGTRWTDPDPAAEGQLAACRTESEEEGSEVDSVAPSPACASLAASPGGKEPDSLCGSESKGQEEEVHDGAFEGGELQAQRGGSIAPADVGCSTPPRPEGCRGEDVVPEQSDASQQSPGGPACREEKGEFPLSPCAAGSAEARALQGSTATGLLRPTQIDSVVVPESSSSDELNLHISDSEAEREENNNSQAHSSSGREAVLKEKHALISESVEHLGGVAEDDAAGGKRTERRAAQGQGEAANPETGGGPSGAADTLAQQNSSCYGPCADLSRAAAAFPETSVTDTAPGGRPPALAEAREELEAPAAEGTELVPLTLPGVSREDLCLLEGDGKHGVEEDQAPGGASGAAEEDGSDLLGGSGQLGSRFANRQGGEAPEECLQSKIAAGVCAEEVERAQRTQEEAPFCLQPEMGMWEPQENTSRSEKDPGCSRWSESSEYDRSLFPKEEESEGCSSRKRHSSKDQVDSKWDPCGQKRPRLLDSGSDLRSSTGMLPSPLDPERHRDQFSRTIGKFLQEYSSQTTLPSGETEEKNRESISQIVRTFFNGTFGPKEPKAENQEVGMSVLPLETRAPEDADGRSAAASDEEGSAAGEETEPSLTFSAGPQLNPVKSPDPSLRSECSSPSSSPRPSGPHTQEQDPTPESAWDAYFSEEEEFQSSISSALAHSLSNSPDASPKAGCGWEPTGKMAGMVFSDISNSSSESEDGEPPPKQVRGSSTRRGSGQLPGMLAEAAEVDLASGGASSSPEPADVGWCQEETSAPPCIRVSSHEPVPIPEADLLAVPGENMDTPLLQQADGTFDREGNREAPGTEASDQGASCASSSGGEAGEEPDDSPNKMQIEDGAFLQRRHEDSSSQELDCKPAVHQPSDSTLWDCRASRVKVEDGDASPSGTASVLVTSASAVANPRGKNSILQSSSFSSMAPSPGQTQVCHQAGNSSLLSGSCMLRSVKQEGCAEAADAEAQGELQSREDGSSLCPLPPRGPANVSDDPEEKGFGEGLGSDLGRRGARWPGQANTRSAAQGDAGGMGRSAGPFLPVGPGHNPMPVCSSLVVQEDAPVLIRQPSLPSASRLVKEEPDPCESHVQVTGVGSCGGYPTACSPVIPVLQTSRASEASGNWVPESPVGSPKEEWPLDAAEAPEQLDSVCMPSGDDHAPCMEAEGGGSSALTVSPSVPEPPPHRTPWACGDGSAQNAGPSRAAGAESSWGKPWASSEQEVAFQLQECQSVLEEISQSLRAVDGIDDLHMEKWREQIEELQKATKMPSTYIAVVGNTGAGKSSLLNALLDEEAVLPTSAMRACTAVVVEISRAAGGGSPYQAEVEFLSQEEWYKELAALLEDMKDKSGNLKRRCPDRKTEAGAAYSRVKAVYGTVDELAKLESMQDVTQHLGTVKRISAETVADFRANIEKFIDSRTDNLREMKGGEFWPIVKCVKIRVAQAEVLKTGAVLVDLPGIRDSNAARDNAAKEYLKNCHAVWVVASITRAVDDKTAKEILNSNLRRQLFMDGQYGNLAFVCTKTDSFNISDIVRDLDLAEEIQPLEEELEELEAQRIQAEEEKGTLHMALHLEQRQGGEATDPAWLQRHHDFLEKEFQLSDLQNKKDAKLRAISLLCVQARNKFSKQRIRMDFSTGLEELKRKAEFSDCDEDGDEDMEDRDFASSDPGDLGDAESRCEKLHVFTVSSTEYLKLSRKLIRDGRAQVFHDPKDTEIPALKNFVIETGLKTSMKATEKVIRDVARVVSQIVHYLTNQRAEDVSHQAQVQEMVLQALRNVPGLLQEAADDVLPDIQYYFGVLIQASLSRGSNKAKEQCEDIVRGWGLPGSGLPHATYHAACLRHGVYNSPKCGGVDLNAQLAKPVNEAITIAWSAVFSSKVEESLERFTKTVLDKLKLFFRELKRKVGRESSLREALDALHLQQMEAVQARLRNFLLDQEDVISRRQRTISRLLTPAIQAEMEPAYAACSQMSGPGYFQKMKEVMQAYVHHNKDSIFDAAANRLQEQLHRLQQYIRENFESLVLELHKSLRMQFEPLLKPVQKNAKIIPDLMNICAKVDKVCKRSCVEYVLPSATQAEAASLEAGGELEANPLCLDVRLGARPPPCAAALQPFSHDAEQLLEAPAPVSVSPCLPQPVSVVQQPQLPAVNLLPFGRKRAGEEAGPALLEKRHKSQTGPDGASSAQMPASELVARPRSAGAAVQAEEGFWGKRCDGRSSGDRGRALQTWPAESGKEASPAGSSWLTH